MRPSCSSSRAWPFAMPMNRWPRPCAKAASTHPPLQRTGRLGHRDESIRFRGLVHPLGRERPHRLDFDEIPNEVDTRFPIASGVKGLTALTVVSLIEDGVLHEQFDHRS